MMTPLVHSTEADPHHEASEEDYAQPLGSL